MRTADSNIYISTGAFKTTSLTEMLAICDELDFHNIELSSGLKWTEHLEEEIARVNNKCNYLIHNYFPPPQVPFVLNLAARNPDVLQLSRDHCKKAVRLCAAVGSPFFSVHSGFAFEVDPSRLGRNLSHASRYPLQEAKEIFVDSVQLLCEYASSFNVAIAIENNVIAPMNLVDGKNLLLLGTTADELLEIRELVNKKNFGFLIDVGHLKISANSLHFNVQQYLSEVQETITAFHLNDNDGILDSNLMFDERSWFIEELRRFPLKCKVIESYQLTIEQLKQEISIVRSL
jgi:Sugar phosphate isomerases/epimerases